MFGGKTPSEELDRLIKMGTVFGPSPASERPRFFPMDSKVAVVFDSPERDEFGAVPVLVATLEQMMLFEIEADPRYAMEVADEFRRLAALTDGLHLPDQ